MKAVLTSCLIFFMIIACANRGSHNLNEKIVGRWIEYKTETIDGGQFDFLGKKLVPSLELEFKNNNELELLIITINEKYEGDYKIEDSVIYFYDYKLRLESLSDDTLVLVNINELSFGDKTIRHYFIKD